MSVFYEFEDVDAFTTGAIGQPGSRVFYLQARHGKQRVAVKCEKQQVSAIAQYLRTVLNDLPPPDDRPVSSALELAEPVHEAFVLGPIGLGYDRTSDRLVVQLEEFRLEDEDDTAGLDTGADDADTDGHIRLYVTRGQAASFCERAEQVVAAGRPDCQWCGSPIDPDGHPCARMN
ncbi:MAG: hypothetical protein CL424_17145 [Acidimicrobiaceae bacterium]|nr:hypothetical protein [Acidimicrobiaceae bacterium]